MDYACYLGLWMLALLEHLEYFEGRVDWEIGMDTIDFLQSLEINAHQVLKIVISAGLKNDNAMPPTTIYAQPGFLSVSF